MFTFLSHPPQYPQETVYFELTFTSRTCKTVLISLDALIRHSNDIFHAQDAHPVTPRLMGTTPWTPPQCPNAGTYNVGVLAAQLPRGDSFQLFLRKQQEKLFRQAARLGRRASIVPLGGLVIMLTVYPHRVQEACKETSPNWQPVPHSEEVGPICQMTDTHLLNCLL